MKSTRCKDRNEIIIKIKEPVLKNARVCKFLTGFSIVQILHFLFKSFIFQAKNLDCTNTEEFQKEVRNTKIFDDCNKIEG